ncbi:uncharacterized protein [Onthophagus taurus]|uniref:uncharacterized protein isoform X2 n=1 Tax=Onthophagus taurus TaxID=166361 RepID=UPI000C20DC6F|nr:uncharacterized protein LOC111425788 isoform X2 [Onthophagus taurus]
MDEVSVTGPSGSNLSEGDLWSGVTEDDIAALPPLPLESDGGGGGISLFGGNFVPPPPRPLFLDDTATPDGLTTCDLCSWAWQNGNSLTLDAAMAPGEIGWVLTLIIVSVISAVVGAVVMIIVLHCKRVQNTRENGNRSRPPHRTSRNGTRPPISTPDDKEISTITQSSYPNPPNNPISNNGVWSWLSCRTTPVPSQLDSPTSPAENHYTHMDEALYAELDQESNVNSNSPAYQNSAYTDPDAPSAPSSAYYSDLSVTTVPDRAYEVVGLSTLPIWEGGSNNGDRRQPPRLASISETVSVPSDYV